MVLPLFMPAPTMKKLCLLLFALFCLAATGCDQEYRNHRAERGKPKITVSDGMLTVRRAVDRKRATGPAVVDLRVLSSSTSYPQRYDYIHSAEARDSFRNALRARPKTETGA